MRITVGRSRKRRVSSARAYYLRRKIYSAIEEEPYEEYTGEHDQYEDVWDSIKDIDQEFTSANTSINATKLPAIFKMVSFEPGTVNCDYGGGRFNNVADYLTQYDVINMVLDPFNRSKAHNREVINLLREHGGADTATCSNVLNVIKEPANRIGVLENMKKLVKPNGKIYITVYEGTGKGNEGETKSGYQLNKKTADYMDEILEVFPNATRKGKLITAINSESGAGSIAASYATTTKYGTFTYELDIVVSGEIQINNGDIDLDTATWILDPMPEYDDYYHDEETGAKIISADDILQSISDILNQEPVDGINAYMSGAYRVDGNVYITVDIDDVNVEDTFYALDEDGDPVYDTSYISDDSTANVKSFDIQLSNVTPIA